MAGTEDFRRDPHVSSASVIVNSLWTSAWFWFWNELDTVDTDTHSKRVIFLQIKPLKQHMHVTVKNVLLYHPRNPNHVTTKDKAIAYTTTLFSSGAHLQGGTAYTQNSFSPDQAIYL